MSTSAKPKTHYLYCPEMEITEPMLEELMTGDAYARLCHSSKKDSEEAHYQLSPWQRQLFEEAKARGILINPTHALYLRDSLHLVWESYCSLHRHPHVEIRIAPVLVRRGILGHEWVTAHHVRFALPNFGWDLLPEGLEGLRFFISLCTKDDPTNDGGEPKTWHKSWVQQDGTGQLQCVHEREALPVAHRVLSVLQQFGVKDVRVVP
jgi:hypothetical protein